MEEWYVRFVVERFKVWQRRQAGLPEPWTDNTDLQRLRFTNVYRILDPGSQFVVKELLYSDQPSFETTVLRALLYRFNNRPEPWVWFKDVHGRYPVWSDLDHLLERWMTYDGSWFNIFAYKVYLRPDTLMSIARDHLPPLVFALEEADSVEQRVELLQTYPKIGDFLSMQIATDLGLSPHVQADENEYVLLGPGARRGAKMAFGDADNPIERARAALGDRVQLEVAPGVFRLPSSMDIQNTFCEFNKVVQLHDREAKSPKRKLAPLPEPFFPPHWSA